MTFWQPVLVLLRVRFQVARHHFLRNPTAFLGTLLLGCLLALAAFGMGRRFGIQWPKLEASAAEAGLQRLWMLMQGFWLLALLLPGGITLLGQNPSGQVLRPFSLRPSQTLAAELLACLLDIPTLLALFLTLPLVGAMLLAGQWGQAGVVLLAFALLALQTGALARLIAALGALSARRMRRWTEIPALTILLLAGLGIGAPPALASLTTPSGQRLQARLVPQTSLSPRFTALFPASMAARSVVSLRRADYPGLLGSLGGLALSLILTGGGALLALQFSPSGPCEAPPHKGKGKREKGKEEVRRQKTEDRREEAENQKFRNPGKDSSFILHPSSFFSSLHHLIRFYALVVTEMRLLLRQPENYLPLRKPASLLLLGVAAFLAPDMGRDPVYNLKELLGIGAVFYNLLWQIQLLCNRFGTEDGTGALLFGFSLSLRSLLLGKNLALFLLLLLLDSGAIAGMCLVSEAAQNIPLLLLWLPMILLVLTALGNLLSALQPFAIARRGRRTGAEPPDALSAVYIALGCAAAALLVPVSWLFSLGFAGILGAMGYLIALYLASLWGTGALLAKRRHTMIACLDGRIK